MWNADLAPRPMTLDEFTPMVGQRLLADCEPKPVEIELASARPLRNYGVVERAPFLLIFRTPPEVVLLTGTYAMKCGEWGPDLIYIERMVPPELKDPNNFYQAVFN